MNFNELIVCIVIAAIAVAVGAVAAGVYGPFYGFLDGLLALVLIPFVLYSFFFALFFCRGHIPVLPDCRHHKCRFFDFEYSERTPTRRVCKCRCGDRYVFLLWKRRFMVYLPDGTMLPYMKLTLFGRWKPDTDAAEQIADDDGKQ